MTSQESLAVVLLSGGLDSATAAAWAKEKGFEICSLHLQYGQRHSVETSAAEKIAQHLGVLRHLKLAVDLHSIGRSALTDVIPVPKRDSAEHIPAEIPVTYVPGRNTVFLALAMSFAESLDAHDIVIGINALDYSGYPDCRPEFLAAFERLAGVGTKMGTSGIRIRIHAPLIDKSKADIVREALRLKVPLELTHSCYDPTLDGAACGRCDSCLYRQKGFLEAGIRDPIRYSNESVR